MSRMTAENDRLVQPAKKEPDNGFFSRWEMTRGFALFFLFMFGFSAGLTLISQPSTPACLAGLAILVGLVIGYAPMVYRFVVDNLNRFAPMLLVAVLLGVGSGCGYSRIEPGHVGIKVHLYGGNKGVDYEPLPVGAVWYNPWTTSIYEYPTFVQTAIWTKSPNEGGPSNEEITFTAEGMQITTDISLSYHLEAEKVPAFFAKFRSDNLSTFTHGFLHNVVRDAFNEIAPRYSVEQLYGERKEELMHQVKDRVNSSVAEYGVVIEQFGVVGAMRLPDQVVQALNAKISATQNALRVQNEVAQATAEAAKTVATAKGAADARMLQANAEAQANKTIAASLTPELVQYLAVQRWNGQRPMVEGGNNAGLLLNLPIPGAK